MRVNLTSFIPGASYIASKIHIPMDSESTARVVDKVDIGKFRATKVFTPTNAATMAALATMAYSTPEDQKKHLDEQPAVKGYRFLDSKDNAKLGIDTPDTGTQVSVVETDKALLVAARGTTPPWFASPGAENQAQWQDYLSDIATVPVQNYNASGLVHSGFKEAADGIWGQLKPILQTAHETHKAIHLSGHSLGAAIALQLGDRMKEELGYLPQSVTRTGGPNIGWGDENKHLVHNGLAARTTNFVNNTDPVPLVLPKGVSSGQTVYFNRNGAAELEGGPHVVDRTLGSLQGWVKGKPMPLWDHVPQLYNEAIQNPQNASTLKKLQR